MHEHVKQRASQQDEIWQHSEKVRSVLRQKKDAGEYEEPDGRDPDSRLPETSPDGRFSIRLARQIDG